MNVTSKTIWDSQKELENCSFVKTVLMITVVFYHCILFWTGTWFVNRPPVGIPIVSVLANWLNSFHVYGFALASGYLLYFLKHEKGRYSTFREFAVNKIKRLLFPYCFIALVWVIPIAQYFYHHTLTEVVWGYVLGISPSQLWFLLMLFGVFMLFYTLSNFFKNYTLGGSVVVIGIYGVGVIGGACFPDIMQLFTACTYIPIFWVGFKLRQGKGTAWIRKIHWIWWIVVDLCLFAISQYISFFDGAIISLLQKGFDLVLHLTGALMSFVVLQRIANHVKWQDSRVFSLLKQHAMPIYLIHQQLVYVCVYWLNGLINPYIHAFISFIVVFGVSLLISILLMKFKLTRLLIGEK